MNSTTELVRRAARRLADDYAVDANLDETLNELRRHEPVKAARAVDQLLEERVKALKSAASDLSRLRGQIASTIENLPYTEIGWPERKRVLEQRLADDPRAGLLAWLDDWATATARGLTDALQRLAHDVTMPPVGLALRERCALSTVGVEHSDWSLAQPVLAALAEGFREGVDALPSDDVRGGLWLLLARLALKSGHPEEAARSLERGEELAPPASVEALRSRLLRERGDLAGARQKLDAARATDPANVDVASELIAQAEGEMQSQMALEVARLTIDALPHIADSERELRPLFGDVPSAIWLAVAERAFREGDFDRCDWAAAETSHRSEPAQVLASIAELRARAGAMRDAPVPERVAALNELGRRWIWAEEPALALRPLEESLDLERDNDHGLVLLANALTARVEAEPLAAARADVERALDLIGKCRKAGSRSLGEAWGYIVEAGAHLLLAPAIGSKGDTHAWLALDAACRGVIRGAAVASYWEQLAAAGNGLQLNEVTELASRQTLQLSPGNGRARATLAAALLNKGHVEEALGHLTGSEPVFEVCVKAYVAIRDERAGEALRLLRGLDPFPRLPLVYDMLIDAVLFGAGLPDAKDEAAAVRSHLTTRLDEHDGRLAAARVEMMLGALDGAERLLQPLLSGRRRTDPHALLGRIQLLKGEDRAGIASLVEAARHASLAGLGDWKSVIEPELRMLAHDTSVELPDLQPVATAATARRAELARDLDPIEELRSAKTGLAEGSSADDARKLCAALVALVRGKSREGRMALEELGPRKGDSEVELLRSLASATPEDTGSQEPELATVEAVHALQVILPPSWFADSSDQGADHPLLVRYIPEMRIRAGWEVPGIQVGVDEALEPDRYLIKVGGVTAAEGRADPGRAYLPAEAGEALGPPAEDGEAPLALPGLPPLRPVAAEPLSEAGSDLRRLLAIPASEVVARHLGVVVEEHAKALGRP